MTISFTSYEGKASMTRTRGCERDVTVMEIHSRIYSVKSASHEAHHIDMVNNILNLL